MKTRLPSGTQFKMNKEVDVFKFKQKLFSSEIMLMLESIHEKLKY